MRLYDQTGKKDIKFFILKENSLFLSLEIRN